MDDQEADRGVGCGDVGVRVAGGVAGLVEPDAKELQALADLGPQPGRVLADAPGEDQGVEAAERDGQGADHRLDPVGIDVQGELCPADDGVYRLDGSEYMDQVCLTEVKSC